MFSCRELLFSKLFSCERPQATEILEKGCFSRISEGTFRHFFGVVLELVRPSEPWCFPAGSCFFRSCFPASGRRQQKFSKKRCFSGISDGTGRRKGELPAGSSRQQAAADTSRRSSSKRNGSSAAASSTKNCVFLGWH